ncbi:uncharacterized protein TA21235 [Theileria annulata]|uniref:Poly(A) RNA polymerase mitochondrial-like central palm domain-containing protein n=1 Tax=Theileria annulata TaxID=5874 RepID=Q4UGR0_THEAN|nr:uncharacterized protein TA21235 [Theileria annulata]CAI73729.1 hypothetical protein TA21235 [Theileria annulata]|eukprot:XP_954406.1 hypothetical protein TA21235 [Theileria annulata]
MSSHKEQILRSPGPYDYCKCRCNVPYYIPYNCFLDQPDTHSNTHSHTHCHTQSNSNDSNDESVNKSKNVKTNRSDVREVVRSSDGSEDSPLMSDETDLTYCNLDNGLECTDFLEGIHCINCDKPFVMYTNLDFKLFDNWINYVFYHNSINQLTHSIDKSEAEADHKLNGRDKYKLNEADKVYKSNDSDTVYNDKLNDTIDEESNEMVDDITSIGDIMSSILMSSEETMFGIINNISPGEHCTNEKNQLFDSVKRFLQYCLGEDTIVHLTGSTAYDIDIDYSEGTSAAAYSDLDIVLLSNSFGGDPRIILQKVYSELTNMQHVLKERNKCPIWVLADSNIKLVESAKVPIIIIETKNGLLCDISVNTLYPLLHTELFKSYIDEHPMVRPLMRIIKHWLIVRGIPTMKEGGFPSILWMSLFSNSLDATNLNTATSNLEYSYPFPFNASDTLVSSEPLDDALITKQVMDNSKTVDSMENNNGTMTLTNSTSLVETPFTYSPNSSITQVSQTNPTNNDIHDTVSSDNQHNFTSEIHDTASNNDENESMYEGSEESEEVYEEFNFNETYREMYMSEYNMKGCSIGQLWNRLQGGRGEYGILCSLEKCFYNLSKGLSLMDIVNRFAHIKNGSDYGGMSTFCINVIRLIEMEPNVPYGTWLVYFYELNRAKEYMNLYSKRLEILVTLLSFLRLLTNPHNNPANHNNNTSSNIDTNSANNNNNNDQKCNKISRSDLEDLTSNICHSFGYDLSYLWDSTKQDPHSKEEFNPLYLNNKYAFGYSLSNDSLNTIDVVSTDISTDTAVSSDNNTAKPNPKANFKQHSLDNLDPKKDNEEDKDVMKIIEEFVQRVSTMLRIQLKSEDLLRNIKLLTYHMFQQFKIIPNEIFEKAHYNLYTIPVSIDPPTPIEDEGSDYTTGSQRGGGFESCLWNDSGWYIVVLQDSLCIVKVIKICIEWDFWWSKEFVSRRDSRSIFHGFVYRQLRLDDMKKAEPQLQSQLQSASRAQFNSNSVNSPSILIKRGALVLFNPCDIVSKLHVLKVVKHEQYISPSLYSTDFYTGVKCIYVLPGFEVDRFMCFDQIVHKLKHYVEFRPQVSFCKLCGIVNMKKINPYTEYKIPQRKLRNAKYVLCNQKYNHIYNLMQFSHNLK